MGSAFSTKKGKEGLAIAQMGWENAEGASALSMHFFELTE